jgi:ectoine hydroxylase-related dioxygenase (phytanoyl-CoA dioxygenase family)
METPYPLTDGQLEAFRADACIRLPGVFTPTEVAAFADAVSRTASAATAETRALEERDTYGKAFLQSFNLWRLDERVRALVFHRRLAGIAARLLGVDGVRLYHDQALFKEPGGGITPWHADQFYWPLETDRTVTAWIPLQDTPLEMGPLEFAPGSQRLLEGRDLKIGDDSEERIGRRLRLGDYPHRIEPFAIGDVSFHTGWVFHRAGANRTEHPRKVMTVIYMDRDMRLKRPEHPNQAKDAEAWCPGIRPGEIVASPLNPVLYEA